MNTNPLQSPEVAALLATYKQQASDLETTLAAVKGAAYADRVRIIVDMQTSLGQLVSMLCGEIPMLVRHVATSDSAKCMTAIISNLCETHSDDPDEFVANVMNVVEARDKLQESMQATVQKLLGEGDDSND